MVTSLERLGQIADEIRSLPTAFPDIFDDVKTGIPSVDEALESSKRESTSYLMEKGGALIDEALQFGAFGDRATLRLNVENSKTTSPQTWQYEAFNFAANEVASFEFAQLDGVRRACGPIADAIEAEIKRMELAPVTPPSPAAKTEQGEGNGGKGKQFHVFLSHNSKNKPRAHELKRLLAERGLNVWLDEDELRPGGSWQKALEEAIKTSESVAVLVGEDGLGPWQDEEMQAALRRAVNNKRPVIPVLLPGSPGETKLPLFLENRT